MCISMLQLIACWVTAYVELLPLEVGWLAAMALQKPLGAYQVVVM
jgi:hypothetical protein